MATYEFSRFLSPSVLQALQRPRPQAPAADSEEPQVRGARFAWRLGSGRYSRSTPLVQAMGWLDTDPPAALNHPSQAAAASQFDGFLVTWQPGIEAEQRQLTRQHLGLELVETIQTPVMELLEAGVLEWVQPADARGGDPTDLLTAIKASAGVESVDFNWQLQPEVFNDPLFANGWLWGAYGPDTINANPFGSNAALAWELGFTGSRNVYIGIIDTGYNPFHPDLASNAGVNPGEIPNNGKDDDGNGYIDDIYGWDFYTNDNSIYDIGQDQHGTHVAGTIGAAGNNGRGIAGVAPNVKLLSAKFLGPNGGYLSDAVKAIDYFTDLKLRHGINIVATNNSWGGGGYSDALANAIQRAASADILFVAAAGNSATNAPSFPASYTNKNVISVAALTSSGALASFSNFGTPHVDLAAPGQAILSTMPDGSYATMSGTSMASPHVAGAIAVLAAAFPQASGDVLRQAILATVTPTPSLQGKVSTGGRLDVVSALDWLSVKFKGEGLSAFSSVSIQADTSRVLEDSGDPLRFTLTLSEPAQKALSINYSLSGTAKAGSDFIAPTGFVTVAPGASTAQISLTPLADQLVEPDEAVVITLQPGSGYRLGDGAQARGIIANDDLPVVSLTLTPSALLEGQLTAEAPSSRLSTTSSRSSRSSRTPTLSQPAAFDFTVQLDQPNPQPLEIRFSVSGTASEGVDYRALPRSIIIPAGQVQGTVKVELIDDQVIEPAETVQLSLATGTGYRLGDVSQQVATILNDDLPEVSLQLSGSTLTEGSDQHLQLRISLSQALSTDLDLALTISGTASNGLDVSPLPEFVTVKAGETAVELGVAALLDELVEGEETLEVSLVASDHYTVAATAGRVTATVIDVQPPPPEPMVPDPAGGAEQDQVSAPGGGNLESTTPAAPEPVDPAPVADPPTPEPDTDSRRPERFSRISLERTPVTTPDPAPPPAAPPANPPVTANPPATTNPEPAPISRRLLLRNRGLALTGAAADPITGIRSGTALMPERESSDGQGSRQLNPNQLGLTTRLQSLDSQEFWATGAPLALLASDRLAIDLLASGRVDPVIPSSLQTPAALGITNDANLLW